MGWSDHTPGWEITIAAVARGACIVEKHLTTDRSLPGPDHQASLDTEQFAAMMRALRAVESSLGDGRKRPHACEAEARRIARKSLVAARDLPASTVLTDDDLACRRPGDGLSPALATTLRGRRLIRPLAAGARIGRDDVEGDLP